MKMVPLGEVVQFSNGGTPARSKSEFWKGDIPWITGADITDEGAVSARSFISQAAVARSSTQVLPEGTVLLLTRTSVGKVAVLPRPMAINQDITGITPSQAVDTRYLMHFLRASKPQLLRNLRGATIQGVTRQDVGSLEFPLAPLMQQRRIAAILDKTDAIRTKRRQVLAHLDALTQSIFHDMFGEDTDHVAIGDFATVRSGSTPPREDPSNFGGNIPWVKTAEVTGVITSTSEKVTDKGLREARLKVFPSGSVVVAMYGQGKTRGQSAILGVPATTNQACAVIMPNRHFLPEFLYAQLVMNYERLRQSSEGGNQPNLSLKRVKEFGVVLPHIESQQEFASRSSEIGHKRNVLLASLGSIDALFDALQSRAFKGEL